MPIPNSVLIHSKLKKQNKVITNLKKKINISNSIFNLHSLNINHNRGIRNFNLHINAKMKHYLTKYK